MELSIIEVAGGADTAEQGEAVYMAMFQSLKADQRVVLNFGGVRTATSSFVNNAFVRLLSDFSLAHIKLHVGVVRSSRQINELIRDRLERAAIGSAAA